MAWERRPVNAASKQRQRDYNSREHKAACARYRRLIDSGHGQCAETVCLHPTRYLPPGSPFHAAHTPDRTAYLGPAHPQCNVSAAGKAGYAAQQAALHKPRRAQSRRW